MASLKEGPPRATESLTRSFIILSAKQTVVARHFRGIIKLRCRRRHSPSIVSVLIYTQHLIILSFIMWKHYYELFSTKLSFEKMKLRFIVEFGRAKYH